MALKKTNSNSMSNDIESRIKSLEEKAHLPCDTSSNISEERLELLETRYRKLISELKACRLPLNWNELSL